MKLQKGENYILTVCDDGIEINEQPKTEDKPEPAKAPVEPVKLYCVKDYGSYYKRGNEYETDANGYMRVEGRISACVYKSTEMFFNAHPQLKDCLVPLVSRPAKVGEWVLITGNTGHQYEAGKIYQVNYVCDDLGKHPNSVYFACDGKGNVHPSEYLVLDGYTEPEPKYYNGDVICINSTVLFHTVGKKYTVTDGVILSNSGCAYNANPFKTLSEFNERQPDKFIEYKE